MSAHSVCRCLLLFGGARLPVREPPQRPARGGAPIREHRCRVSITGGVIEPITVVMGEAPADSYTLTWPGVVSACRTGWIPVCGRVGVLDECCLEPALGWGAAGDELCRDRERGSLESSAELRVVTNPAEVLRSPAAGPAAASGGLEAEERGCGAGGPASCACMLLSDTTR